MTLTKVQIIEEIMTRNGFNRKKATETIETLRKAKDGAPRQEPSNRRGYDAGTKKGCDVQVFGEVAG